MILIGVGEQIIMFFHSMIGEHIQSVLIVTDAGGYINVQSCIVAKATV